MSASTAHTILLALCVLVALAAVGCNAYMLYEIEWAFEATDSPGPHLTRWRALLIAAEAICGAVALYALAHNLVRRSSPSAPFVAARTDIVFLLLFAGGTGATGVLLFLTHVPSSPHHRLYSIPHCAALGRKCPVHFAGGGALLLACALLLVTALFEVLYASGHPGGWGESVHALAAELGSEGLKIQRKSTRTTRGKRASHLLSISEPFREGAFDDAKAEADGISPLMMAPAPCATLPYRDMNGMGGGGMGMGMGGGMGGGMTGLGGGMGVVGSGGPGSDDPDSPTSEYPSEYASTYAGSGAPPRPARPESTLQPESIRSGRSKQRTSVGTVSSVSTLASTPLFGLAPAVQPARRTSSLAHSRGASLGGGSSGTLPARSPGTDAGTFGRTRSAISGSSISNPYSHAGYSPNPNAYASLPSSSSSPNPYSASASPNPYSVSPNPYSGSAPSSPYRPPSRSARDNNPYRAAGVPFGRMLEGVDEGGDERLASRTRISEPPAKPKLSLEQIDRKRTLFAEGRL